MSDGKRQSFAGKVATPRGNGPAPATPTSPAGGILEEMAVAIGARVRITTSQPNSQTHEGTLFAACPISQLVAINTRSAPPNPSTDAGAQPGDYHVTSASRIASFQVLSPAKTVDGWAILPVDQKRLAQRETDRITKLKEDEQNRGKGVTAEGQAIFDSFKRINTPIRWHNQEMIVHDAVIISPPYTVDDCRGAKDKQETLNRVKKVLEGERRKIRDRNATGNLRKGG